jgi:hypothetical protein
MLSSSFFLTVFSIFSLLTWSMRFSCPLSQSWSGSTTHRSFFRLNATFPLHWKQLPANWIPLVSSMLVVIAWAPVGM